MSNVMPAWRGKPLSTYGDVTSAMQSCASREDAQDFMRHFRQYDSKAAENIGYLTGYFSPEKADQMRDWFQVVHPIFGTETPTPEEALRKGIELGQKASKG